MKLVQTLVNGSKIIRTLQRHQRRQVTFVTPDVLKGDVFSFFLLNVLSDNL